MVSHRQTIRVVWGCHAFATGRIPEPVFTCSGAYDGRGAKKKPQQTPLSPGASNLGVHTFKLTHKPKRLSVGRTQEISNADGFCCDSNGHRGRGRIKMTWLSGVTLEMAKL